ncbi:elongin-B-like [Rattus norvegicus]|uniref:elongin-B-like n=1 Tax=Rattus norvegicus TaxID=10116 RepID=UPI0000DA21D9|nr:elongin-B-like [Rattus norvegicus]
MGMDVFLITQHKKTTILTEGKELSMVLELKHIVEGIVKRPPDEQLLIKNNQLPDEMKTLWDCDYASQVAKSQAPTLGQAFRTDNAFESLHI